MARDHECSDIGRPRSPVSYPRIAGEPVNGTDGLGRPVQHQCVGLTDRDAAGLLG